MPDFAAADAVAVQPSPGSFSSNPAAEQSQAVPLSGDPRVDALLSGRRWNASTISYSFYAGGGYYGSDRDPTELPDAVQTVVRSVLHDIIAPMVNLTFNEVPDTPSEYGTIRILMVSGSADASPGGWAYYPGETDVAGDILLNRDYDFTTGPGSYTFYTVVHEVGHALGLKHPGDYGGPIPPYLPHAEDNRDNSTMTYNNAGKYTSTLMPYDVLALQHMYGSKGSTRPTNDSYVFTAVDQFSPGGAHSGLLTRDGDTKQTLWDAGGIDTIDLSALPPLASGYRVDINPGGWITRTEGYDSVGYDAAAESPATFSPGTSYFATDSGTRVAFGAVIENVVPSRSDDLIFLNDVANRIGGYVPDLTSGNDVIYGSDRFDTLDLSRFSETTVGTSRVGDDLVLNLGTTGTVTVKDYYAASPESQMVIQFRNRNSPLLLRDINRLRAGSDGDWLTPVGNTLFFTANDGVSGEELWKSDGSEAGTVRVKDIWPGDQSSAPHSLTPVGNTLFFIANDGSAEERLWRSDGSGAGTRPVTYPHQSRGATAPSDLTKMGSMLFFTAEDGVSGRELWKSDGTEAGTVLVRDVLSGNQGSRPQSLTVVGETLFFTAFDATGAAALWKTDGTEAGTVRVRDLQSSNPGTEPRSLTAVEDVLFFVAGDGMDRSYLWKTDGSPAGTMPIVAVSQEDDPSESPSLIAMGRTLLFTADDGTSGKELWKSDGSPAGTSRVKDIRTGGQGSNPASLTAVGDTVFFIADDGTSVRQLWKTDGSEAGTVRIPTMEAADQTLVSDGLTAVGDKLFFAAADGMGDEELWKINDSGVGAVRVKDIRSGVQASNPRALTAVGGRLFFIANDGVSGEELWLSDGTETGTVRVKDIRSGGEGSSLHELLSINSTTFFRANDGVSGSELWKTDGSESGTILVKDIRSGSLSSSPKHLTALGSTLFFTAVVGASGRELWKTDGSTAGTVQVKDVRTGRAGSTPANLTAVGSVLYFTANDGVSGTELWKSDGTELGTVLVKDIRGGRQGSSPADLVGFGSHLFFTADDGTSGRELWKTDGTAQGTTRIADLYPGPQSSSPRDLTVTGPTLGRGERLYFTADDGVSGRGLWSLDPSTTRIAAVNLLDRASGQQGFAPADLTAAGGGRLVFTAEDSVSGRELWVTGWFDDATRIELRPGPSSSFPRNLTTVPRALLWPWPDSQDAWPVIYFVADDDVSGSELWKLDGLSPVRVRDINPGPSGSTPRDLTRFGSLLTFVADDGTNGPELWRSDGTEAGTIRLTDVRPGFVDPKIANLTPVGSRLHFTADDGAAGRELWSIVIDPPLKIVGTQGWRPGNRGLPVIYRIGQRIRVTLYLSEAVVVTGSGRRGIRAMQRSIRLRFSINDKPRFMTFAPRASGISAAGGETTTLSFSYIVSRRDREGASVLLDLMLQGDNRPLRTRNGQTLVETQMNEDTVYILIHRGRRRR